MNTELEELLARVRDKEQLWKELELRIEELEERVARLEELV